MNATHRVPSLAICEQVLAALKAQRCLTAEQHAEAFAGLNIEPQIEPKLVMDFDWLGHGGHPSIVWEEGPYEWAHLFPYGGIEEEFGFRVKDVSSMMPKGWYAEAITSWSMGIYEA